MVDFHLLVSLSKGGKIGVPWYIGNQNKTSRCHPKPRVFTKMVLVFSELPPVYKQANCCPHPCWQCELVFHARALIPKHIPKHHGTYCMIVIVLNLSTKTGRNSRLAPQIAAGERWGPLLFLLPYLGNDMKHLAFTGTHYPSYHRQCYHRPYRVDEGTETQIGEELARVIC